MVAQQGVWHLFWTTETLKVLQNQHFFKLTLLT